tara:strand:+ start:889 stop:1017 length:129 start_codon:yes stop_codon:yes gene_type:complete
MKHSLYQSKNLVDLHPEKFDQFKPLMHKLDDEITSNQLIAAK